MKRPHCHEVTGPRLAKFHCEPLARAGVDLKEVDEVIRAGG